jgi:protein TonB
MTTIMKNLQKTDKSLTNGGQISESDKKRDVNLKSNSSLYFQIGLILCLLATYGLFEMNFNKSIVNYNIEKLSDENAVFYLPKIKEVPVEVKKEPQPKKQLAVLITKPPVIKPDDYVIPKPVSIVTPDSYVSTPAPVASNAKPDETPTPAVPSVFNMKDVEMVPIFPECESAKNNAERMACMSEQLTKLIQKKFNTDLAHDLGLTGIQKIQVQFKIDATGHVTDIKTRSPYSQLEKEAERVVSKIPVMTPGMQRNTPVSVVYNLPIAFQVH